MPSPRILVVGCNGQVGWELCRTGAPLGHIVAVDYPDVDLSSSDSIRHCLEAYQPRVIINAAAYTAVDKAEAEPDLARKINGEAPGIMGDWASKHGAWLIHYSTDYVFDGTKQSGYVETDPPGPLSSYGRSKLAGDEAVRAATAAHLIFRLCWVYGARGQNFLCTITRLAKEREQLKVVSDQVGCPTWSRFIAEATALALNKVLATPDPAALAGTYHLAASGLCSWHTFASAIVAAVPEAERRCREVLPITTAEYPLPARRPAHSVLNCDKLEATFGLRLPSWQDHLRLVSQT